MSHVPRQSESFTWTGAFKQNKGCPSDRCTSGNKECSSSTIKISQRNQMGELASNIGIHLPNNQGQKNKQTLRSWLTGQPGEGPEATALREALALGAGVRDGSRGRGSPSLLSEAVLKELYRHHAVILCLGYVLAWELAGSQKTAYNPLFSPM